MSGLILETVAVVISGLVILLAGRALLDRRSTR